MRRSMELRAQMKPLRDKLQTIDAELLDLANKDELTEGEATHWERLTRQRGKLMPEYEELQETARRVSQEEIRAGLRDGSVKMYDGYHNGPDHRAYAADVTGHGLRALDRLAEETGLSSERYDQLEKELRSSPSFAAEFECHSDPAYASAFWTILREGDYARASVIMSDEERAAMYRSAQITRAMNEGAPGTAGGFGVPTYLDPSVILTAQGSADPVLSNSRVVDVVTNVWKGVSSAGVTWSFDNEATEVSDDSPTLGQPSVTVYTARGFIPYSIEVGEDYPGFQSEMARLLESGYNELVADKLAKGSGSGEPRGIITALDANTNVEVVNTSDGSYVAPDIHKLWKALPERFRANASWVMSVDVWNRSAQFESANGALLFPEIRGANPMLLQRPVYTSSYFPDITGMTTTSNVNIAVVGDFTNYVVARRTGLRVELVPHLLGGAGRPTGQRGLFAYARLGGNSVNDLGFRLLQNVN